MNFKNVFLSLILSIGLFSTFAIQLHSQDANADYIIHTVVQGETAYSVAAAYKTTVDELCKLNPTAKDGIRVNQNLLVPQIKARSTSHLDHIIEPKETLYTLAKQHNIKVVEIIMANPGLTASTFKAGSKIRIPVFGRVSTSPGETIIPVDMSNPLIAATTVKKEEYGYKSERYTEYRVQKQETLYSLSKAWNVTIKDITDRNPSLEETGLKEGSIIYIPNHAEPTYKTIAGDVYYPKDINVRVAVLLPFLQGSTTVEKDKITEYYEGMLMAIKELKERGMDAQIYSFDIGGATDLDRLRGVLETNEVKDANLIIGGISQEQIKEISRYSKEHGVKYVVPFGAVNDELEINPNLYQATNSHSVLYWDIANIFKSLYTAKDYNVIFVSKPDKESNNKEDFVDALKKTLVRSQIPFKNLVLGADFAANLQPLLSNDKKNLIVPTSSSETTIRKLMPVLNSLDNETQLALFGYPEWQIYTSFINSFHKYDTYIYSIFYFDAHQEKVTKFGEEYKQWFGKKLVNSYPKYAHLGYDTALYFLTALERYGLHFETKTDNMIVPTIQSSMYFKKVNAGGYINNGLYLIHYKPDGAKEKIDCNKQW